jgi:hypothetical protein
VLLQSHLSRTALPTSELRADASGLLERAHTLAAALVDVIASEGWLKPVRWRAAKAGRATE